MKRACLLVLAVAALLAAITTAAIAQELKAGFSKPVLIGGDNPASPASSAAAMIEFFSHPVVEGARNFKVERDKIEADSLSVYIDDVFATPGAATGKAVSATSPIMDNPGARVASPGIEPINPLGPNDMSLSTSTGFKMTWGLDYSLAEGENVEGRRLALGDVRVEEEGEFKALFGKDPLDTLLIGGARLALLGNASEVSPYDSAYPATVVAKNEAFQWCSIPRFKMPWLGHKKCLMPLGSHEYKDVLIYDAVDIGNGIVGVAYDPFIVRNEMEWYLNVNGFATPPGYVSMTVPPVHTGVRGIAYHSPLVLFRKAGEGASARYKFSGYSSFQFPQIEPGKKIGEILWPFILTNWMVPLASNPIAIEAVDPKDPLDRSYSDLAVLYRNLLLNLDATVHGFRARPAVFETDLSAVDSSLAGHKTFRDMLGVCSDDACTSISSGVTEDLFPDRTFALMVVWRQAGRWLNSAASGEYEKMNPSHVFQPEGATAIVGGDAYDMAVLTDFAEDTEGLRKQHILIPSAYDAPGSDAVLYVVDENSRRIGTRPIKKVDPAFMADPIEYESGTCGYIDFVPARPTPLLLPGLIKVPRPADGLVPYRIESGRITDDRCADFVITWRGSGIVADPENAGHVKFDDGAGRMFSNSVTLGLRRETVPGACSNYAEIEYRTIDVPSTAGELPQIAAAAVGRFMHEGEGGYASAALKADILAGNAVPESDGDGAYSSHAYLFKAALDYSTLPQDMERFRTGFASFEEKAKAAGVADISAKRADEGPDAIAQVTGRPLMLPDAGCPDYSSGSDDPTVGSVFQTYRSVIANLWSAHWTSVSPAMYKVAIPFRDDQFHPLPVGCGEPEPCVISWKGKEYRLPFYKDDPCCKVPCSEPMEFEVSPCGSYFSNQYMPFSCDIVEYRKAWFDCDTSSSTSRNGSEGTTDVIVGHDRGAIAVASELRPAQFASQNSRQVPGTAGQVPGANVLRTDQESPLSFRQLVSSLIAEGFPDNAEAQQALDGIFDDKDLRNFLYEYEKLLTIRKAPDGMFGPPLSFEEIFLIPIYQTVMLSERLEAQAAYEGKPGGFRALGGGCSIAPAVEEARGPAGAGSKVGSVLKRIWDLIVPDAGAAVCGDGIKDAPEECDPKLDPTGCEGPFICVNDSNLKPCTCIRKRPYVPLCGDGIIEGTEQCDGWNADLPCGAGNVCVNCRCISTPPIEQAPASPAADTPAAIAAKILAQLKLPKGQIMPGHRETTALIRIPSKTAAGEGPAEAAPQGGGLQNDDCVVRCATFPGEKAAEKYKALNDEIRAITGRSDDFICPPEQGVTVLCRVDGASAPGAAPSELSLSLSGTPLPGIPGNLMPYSVVQTDGSKFIDETTLEFRTFETLDKPIQLIPLDQQAAGMVVPSMAMSLGAMPMIATSISGAAEGTLLVNNMYSHRVISSGSEEAVSLGLSQTPQGLLPGTAVTIHEMKFRTVNTGGSWTAVEGAMPGLKPIEERIDWEQLKSMLAERVAQLGGAAPRASLYVDTAYPVVPNQRYAFGLYQEKYAAAGGTTDTVDVPFGFIVGEPMIGAQGGGCGCFVGSSAPTASSVLPLIIALLAPAGGIAYLRIRRRNRK
ncbi:MAG: DUF4215 domain-containing protein [Proteobacteria bacterium]|nr:DUF4215 domain-containing protein [Pseudomonadota bacterium]